MRITAVISTDLFAGSAARPLQIIQVNVANDASEPTGALQVRVDGAGVTTPVPARLTGVPPGTTATVEVPVEFAAPYQPGTPRPVTAVAETVAGTGAGAGAGARQRAEFPAQVPAAEPGWTMWMVSHFHYDPVWWGTQGQFTESRLLLPEEDGSLPDVRTAFDLVRLHLAKARADRDYKFVLAELDYLKPHFDAYPEDRADVRRFIAEGRIELVGGTYNEPNTNLTGAESTIRNAVYGMGFQRDVMGADPRSAWMLDVFGHDPGFPGLMAAAGLTSSSWARGPFHQWGPSDVDGGNLRMQFPAEFEWMSPDGTGLLTAYMANHYSAGWALHRLPDLASAEAEALIQFRSLAAVAATRNVMLPVGTDHVIPANWVTEIHRDWNARYVWPRFVTAVPADFFAAVRADAEGTGTWFTPQTRDMNPVYTGKDVSYADTKQAQRAAEVACLDGERLATLAWLAGAPYPAESLDKAWRQLSYGAHHDAITGTEGDQVYLDLLAGWREAWERGNDARGAAIRHLAGAASPASSQLGLKGPVGTETTDGERSVSVFNTLATSRSGLTRTTLTFPEPGPAETGPDQASTDQAGAQQVALTGPDGEPVPFLAEGARRHPDGSLAELTVTFRATDVPAVGYRAFRATREPAGQADPADSGWAAVPGLSIENDTFLIAADAERGGTLASIVDKRTGASLLRGPGNEAELAEEHPAHPRWGEGPWHLSPNGIRTGSARGPARVRAERCPVGSRLVAEFDLDGLAVTQETVLWDGEPRVEFRTHVDGSIGQDRMLRIRFPADVPGGLPLYETATAVIGRPFGHPDVDTAEHAWTLDNPAHDWFGLGSTARVALTGADGARLTQAIGVAEVVTPAGLTSGHNEVRALIAALAAAGVTATCSRSDGPRYGGIDADSNVPDVRITLGGPDENAFTAAALAAAGNGYAKELAARAEAGGAVRLWLPAAQPREQTHQPSADLRGPADLPVLIVTGPGPDGLAGLTGAMTALTEDLADAVIEVPAADLAASAAPADPPLADWSVALLNRGTPSGVVSPDGTLVLSLMRSCSSWPAGVWIDGDRQAMPDGSSFAWQHWSHTFEYALVSGPGDWRQAGFGPAGAAYNHELVSCEGGGQAAVLAPGVSLVEVDHPAVQLSALKPRGNPLARGLPGLPAAADGLTLRLRETEGRPAQTRVRLRGGIAAARLTDLLEDRDGASLTLQDEEVVVDLPPFGTVTAAVWPVVPPAAGLLGEPPVPQGTTNLLAQASVPDGTLAGLLEPAQPVYSRYWLHGKGPAPAGNLPVAVHISPRLSGLTPDDSVAELRVTVACGTEPASGTLRLLVPDELAADVRAPGRESASAAAYDLPARGYADWDVRVRARAGTPPGRYVVAAQISDDLGQVIEDTAFVQAGGPGEPDLYQPLDQALTAVEASTAAIAAELDLAVLTPALRLAPGAIGEVAVEVTNRLASPLRAEAQLVSPFGSWEALGPWTQGLRAAPGTRAQARFGVRIPGHVRPGTQWWALVKIMYFGRVRYSAVVPVTVTAEEDPS
ncbi:MAG TPA: glycoside hydrolase family 38 C-terminal domain-containing protein [Streptosporangiaceae bacterium]